MAFKQAAEKVKASGNEAKTGGEGFKSASFKIKEAGALSKSGGDAFKQAAEKVREAGTISKTGGNGFKVSADLAHRAGQVASQSGGGFVKLKTSSKPQATRLKRARQNLTRSRDAIKNFSVGAVAFKAVSSAMNLVSQSMDKAIDRFDTLQRFPKVMKSLGHSSKRCSVIYQVTG